MSLTIRKKKKDDYNEVEVLTREAFWNIYRPVFITGDENYYKRFGFESASKYGIHLEGVPVEDEAPFFMVKTLKEDVLKDIEGNFIFDECYNVNDEDVDEFDKNFEFKKKEVREGQLK